MLKAGPANQVENMRRTGRWLMAERVTTLPGQPEFERTDSSKSFSDLHTCCSTVYPHMHTHTLNEALSHSTKGKQVSPNDKSAENPLTLFSKVSCWAQGRMQELKNCLY